MRPIDFTVGEAYDGQKLLSFLRGEAQLSLKLIRSLKRVDNGILINGAHARTIDIINKGDTVTVNIPDDGAAGIPCELMPEVVYEDNDLLIVNKPAMLPIHESHNHQGDTLANSVAGYLQKKGLFCSFRAVGRLDKGTSGLVVCALNPHAAAKLSGNVKKRYLAVACGEFKGSGTNDAPIYRPDPVKTLRTVDERGDKAVTHWESLKTDGKLSLLSITLETGRTHQIRVHFASLGAPLIGDTMYGKPDERISHQALHCCALTLTHPVTGEVISCTAEMPQEMQKIADSI